MQHHASQLPSGSTFFFFSPLAAHLRSEIEEHHPLPPFPVSQRVQVAPFILAVTFYRTHFIGQSSSLFLCDTISLRLDAKPLLGEGGRCLGPGFSFSAPDSLQAGPPKADYFDF